MVFGKKLWIVGNSTEKSQRTVEELTKLLKKEEIIFDENTPEIVISVGGDGTLLHAMHLYEEQLEHIRFIGVHTGHLGFYTDFIGERLDKVVTAVKNEREDAAVRYPLVRVQVNLTDGTQLVRYVLNESTIRRTSRTMVADVQISGQSFEQFRGDGLSVSTPTGSTAYNKSVGGAVMHPQVMAMQLAEIASLNNRVYRTLGAPMIVAEKDTISILPEQAEDYSITIDQLNYKYKNIQSIEYKLDGTKIAFANCEHRPFWERVRRAFISG